MGISKEHWSKEAKKRLAKRLFAKKDVEQTVNSEEAKNPDFPRY